MKKAIFTLAVLVMAFGNVGFAQQRIDLKSIEKTTMLKHYGLRERSDMMPQTANWQDTYGDRYRVTYEYDEYDYYLITELYEVYWDGAWQPFEMMSYDYDFSGNVLEMLVQDFDGEEWLDMAKASYSYENDLVSECIIQYYEDGNWLNVEKAVYNYNGDVSTILYWDWNGTNWSSSELYTYTQGNGTIELLIQYMQGGAWQNDDRIVYTLTFDEYVEAILEQDWMGTTWINERLTNYNYENGVFPTKTIKEWSGTAWEDDLKFLCEYDEEGNATHGESFAFDGYDWNAADGDIEMAYGYNADSKIFYGFVVDMTYVDLTSVYENAQANFKVYPVPAENEIQIQAEGFQKAEIYSVTGQKLMESTVNVLNVNTLSTGIYLLKVYNLDGNSETQRIVVK